MHANLFWIIIIAPIFTVIIFQRLSLQELHRWLIIAVIEIISRVRNILKAGSLGKLTKILIMKAIKSREQSIADNRNINKS